jgi:ribosomal protein L24E
LGYYRWAITGGKTIVNIQSRGPAMYLMKDGDVLFGQSKKKETDRFKNNLSPKPIKNYTRLKRIIIVFSNIVPGFPESTSINDKNEL